MLAIVLALLAIGGIIYTLHAMSAAKEAIDSPNSTVDSMNSQYGTSITASHRELDAGGYYFGVIIEAVVAVPYLLGGFLLINHKNGGRILLIILSCLGAVGGLIGMIAGFASGVPVSAAFAIPGLLIVALMLFLTLSSGTMRWCGVTPPQAPQINYAQPQYPRY